MKVDHFKHGDILNKFLSHKLLGNFPRKRPMMMTTVMVMMAMQVVKYSKHSRIQRDHTHEWSVP